MRWIVTLRYKRDMNPHKHDPNDKQEGDCLFDFCTDMTGNHHSFVYNTDKTIDDIKERWDTASFRVSRIEAMHEVGE